MRVARASSASYRVAGRGTGRSGGGRAGTRRGGRGNGSRRTSGAGLLLVAVLIAVGLAIAFGSQLSQTVRRLELPLGDAQVIREQAAAKHLDPALIAAVIYAETKFDPRTSSAGAQGLMQILPSTALFLAHLSGGVSFTTSDLSTPAVNVAYGSYYLRYLLDRYGGDEMLAVAAYNAGLANVDSWVAKASSEGKTLQIEEIPFGQTRAYVQRVLQAQSEYRALYARQLGLG
jgi:soluble lytic murein transglycosylase